MKVAIFGGSGFIGSYIVDACISAGHQPILLVRKGSERKVTNPDQYRIVAGDLSDSTAILKVLEGADAAIYSVGLIREFPQQDITFDKLHVQCLKRVIGIAEEAGLRRLILISANGAAPSGTRYQRTKFEAEESLRNSSLEGVILKPSIVFGDPGEKFEFTTTVRDSIISLPLPAPLFFRGFNIKGAGTFKLAPLHVRDVAQIAVRSLQGDVKEDTYGLCGNTALSWRELINTIARALGRKKMMVPVPIWAVKIPAAFFDRFGWFPVTRDQLDMLVEGNVCDAREVFERFDINPIPFDERSLGYLAKGKS
ncbi:NAD(P)H-binding protein [Candidatus Latescibacterota bacterium]